MLITCFKGLKKLPLGQIAVGFFFFLFYKSYAMICLLVSSCFISTNHFHTKTSPSNTISAFKSLFLSALTDTLFSFRVCCTLLKCDFSDLLEAAYVDGNVQ